jgi:hypothetical protein
MPLKTESIIIDGMDFKVTQFGAEEAFRIKRRLASIFVPLLSGLFANAETGKEILDTKVDMKEMVTALTGALEALDEDAFIALIKRLLANTAVTLKDDKGELMFTDFGTRFRETLDAAFIGNTFALYPLLFFVLKVNYPDFFKRVKGIGGLVKTLMSRA